MAQRTCSVDTCDRPHLARGMCSSHYGTWHRKVNGRKRSDEYFTIVCIVCDAEHRAARAEAKYCSTKCKGIHYSQTMRRKSPLPAEHPVMLLIAEAKRAATEARRKPKVQPFAWRTARECPACACWFTPLYTPTAVCCSTRCQRKMSKRRRRAREHNTLNDWRWSDFMRVARKFEYRCAYCDAKPDQLEPDHVVPLSRGGADSIGNILPSCHNCNADKNAHTPGEWAARRVARGKPPRRTQWDEGDARFVHLTSMFATFAA